MKAYKLRFYPTLAQRRQFAKEFSACRSVWNWALETRTQAYRQEGQSLNAVALSRKLTLLKSSQPFLKAASATALNNVLWSQDEAFQEFFKKQARYPRFKKRGRVNACGFSLDKRRGDKIFIPGERLRLPKLGDLNIPWSYRDIPAFPNSATVSRNPSGQRFVSLQCDCIDVINPPATNKTIGLDLGLSTLVATSDGKKEKPRRFLKNRLRRLKFAQRRLSKTARGGKPAQAKEPRGSYPPRNSQPEGKLSARVKYFRCTREPSNSSGRFKRAWPDGQRKARPIRGGCGGYELRRQLSYKAKWYGRQLNVVPRFQRTTGVCPECGTVGDKLPLRVRTWTCGHCGSSHDRDIAAAQVIDHLGNTVRSTGIDACGLVHKPDDSGTTRDNTGAGLMQEKRSE